MANGLGIHVENDTVIIYQDSNDGVMKIELDTINTNGEIFEEILNKLHLSEQIFRQLFFKQSNETIKNLVEEKITNDFINNNENTNPIKEKLIAIFTKMLSDGLTEGNMLDISTYPRNSKNVKLTLNNNVLCISDMSIYIHSPEYYISYNSVKEKLNEKELEYLLNLVNITRTAKFESQKKIDLLKLEEFSNSYLLDTKTH